MEKFLRSFAVPAVGTGPSASRLKLLAVLTARGAAIRSAGNDYVEVAVGSTGRFTLKGAPFAKVNDYPIRITGVIGMESLTVSMVEALGDVDLGAGPIRGKISIVRIGLAKGYERAFDHWQRIIENGMR